MISKFVAYTCLHCESGECNKKINGITVSKNKVPFYGNRETYRLPVKGEVQKYSADYVSFDGDEIITGDKGKWKSLLKLTRHLGKEHGLLYVETIQNNFLNDKKIMNYHLSEEELDKLNSQMILGQLDVLFDFD